MREIKTYFKGAPFYNAFLRAWRIAFYLLTQFPSADYRRGRLGYLTAFIARDHATKSVALNLPFTL